MRFLIDADLPRSVAKLLHRYGHDPIDVRDVSLSGAKDSEIARYAQQHGLCLLTGDYDFSDVRLYPPKQYAGIVVLRLPKNSTAKYILHLLEGFLQQDQLVAKVPGKLTIVEPGRVRIRAK